MTIENDAQYFQVLNRIRKGAEKIASPLTDPKDKEEYEELYAQLVKECQQYRREENSRKYPYMKRIYVELGFIKESEPEPLFEPPDEVPAEPPTKPNYASFLDD